MRGAYYYLGVGTGSVVAGRIIRARGYEFLYELGAAAMIDFVDEMKQRGKSVIFSTHILAEAERPRQQRLVKQRCE